MSQHRRPCLAEVPKLLLPDGENLPGHQHACIHDAAGGHELVEHECSCGMTWQASRPAPDLSWLEPDKPGGGGGYKWVQVEGLWSRLGTAVREMFGVRQ